MCYRQGVSVAAQSRVLLSEGRLEAETQDTIARSTCYIQSLEDSGSLFGIAPQRVVSYGCGSYS